MLLKISISIKCCLLYFLFIKNNFYQLLKRVCIISDNENHFNNWVSNQLIRMISYGSYDTEDWSNAAENSALPSQE